MGATTQRVAHYQVSNTLAANTGNSVTTIVNDDVILFDRSFTEVADTATVQNSPNADQLYVALGVGNGALDAENGIQTRNIRRVKLTTYTPEVPYSATIAVGTPTNNTDYVFKIIYRDEYPTSPGHSAPRSFTYTSDATATAVEIAAGIVAAVNVDRHSQQYVVATADGAGNFTITGKPQPIDIVSGYERVTFDVAAPAGFVGTTITYNGGTAGAGIGAKLKEMERDNNNYNQRRLWPIPADTTRATNGGKYNVVTIEHNHSHLADFSRPALEPRKAVICFLTTDGTASAKQTAFMTKLTSVVESAGIFVS